jgi:hypothetical protein
MDISNIGTNPYAAGKAEAVPTADSPDQKRAGTETDQKTTSQPAFEVNITKEARELQAAQKAPQTNTADSASKETAAALPTPPPEPEQTPIQTHEARQIVNIVA